MSELPEASRIDELLTEYYALQDYLEQAQKEDDLEKLRELQAQRLKLLEEIHAINPNFEKEAA